MKSASLNEIKKNLERKNFEQLFEYCLRLARFKKENKELLSFLLFDADNLAGYIDSINKEMDAQFIEINQNNIYYIKKSVRKILRNINKHIRFAQSKEVEAELLIHFCNCIIRYSVPVRKSRQLLNLCETQLKKIDKILSEVHPDLQYDLKRKLLTA